MLRRIMAALRHPVSQNVIALYGLQIAMFIVPLVTLPYVARTLHPSAFGLVVFAQGFAFVLVVFIEWGLGLTAVRSTAERQGDSAELSRVVQGVRGAQLLLAAASVPLAVGAWLVVPQMSRHPEFLVLAWVAAAATAISPGWFFLGTEKMRAMALVQLGFRVLGAVLTFVLVKDAGGAWIVMALFAASAVGGLVAADLMMYRQVEFRLPEWRASVDEIRRATTIFVGTLALTLYTSFNVVLLGLFASSAEVAHFGAAERLVRVAITILGPVGAAVAPRLTALQAAGNSERARRLLLITIAVSAVPALSVALGLVVFAPTVVDVIYGDAFGPATVPILRVLAILIPVNVAGVIFCFWLMTLHKDRLVAAIVLGAGITNVALGCVLTPAFGPIGMAWSVIAAEAVAALGGFLAVRRDRGRPEVALGASPA